MSTPDQDAAARFGLSETAARLLTADSAPHRTEGRARLGVTETAAPLIGQRSAATTERTDPQWQAVREATRRIGGRTSRLGDPLTDDERAVNLRVSHLEQLGLVFEAAVAAAEVEIREARSALLTESAGRTS
jgi:hypothetical protein